MGQVARKLDRRLRLGGGLLSALEVEEGRSGRLGLLLSKNLRGRFALRTILAAAIPNSTPLLAVPLIGVASLVLALGSRPVPPDPMSGVPQVLGGLATAVQEAVDAAMEGLGEGEVTSEEVEQVRGLAAEARDLAYEAEHMGQDPGRREELSARVERLADGLEQAARGAEGRPELAEPLEQALTLSDMARLAGGEVPSPEPGSAPEPGGSEAQGAGQVAGSAGAPGGPDSAAEGGAEDGAGSPPLAKGDGDGTIAAPPGGTGSQEPSQTAPRHVPPPAYAGGVALGPWWPERHDGVVRRYVEERRKNASDPEE